MKRKYNGHDSYNAWNVSLWINNDEGLYNLARRLVSHCTRDGAASRMLEELHSAGITETPDGVKYTKTTIRKAMVDM